MNIFQFPPGIKVADKEGAPTSEFTNFMNALLQQMQQKLSSNGYQFPEMTAAQVATMTGQEKRFLVVGQTDDNTLRVNINGVIKEIPTV